MQEIVDTLKRERAMLIDRGDSFANGINGYKGELDYQDFLEQNVSPDILNMFERYEEGYNGSELVTIDNVIEMQIIKNIGIDEYNNIYKKNKDNWLIGKTAWNGLSYANEVERDAYIAVINRIFDNIINFIENEGFGREEAINTALTLEYSEVEAAIIQDKAQPTKDPRVRIDELFEMATRQRGNNRLYWCSSLFKAYQFNMSKILDVPYECLENIMDGVMENVFQIRAGFKRNLPVRQNQEIILNNDQKQTIRRILNQRGEDTASIYINCIKPFLSTYFDEGEDPIQKFCSKIDSYARNEMLMEDTVESDFKEKIKDYIKNMNEDDFNMLKATLAIPEVKQALNDKSCVVMFPNKVGDLLIEQINQINISKIVGF